MMRREGAFHSIQEIYYQPIVNVLSSAILGPEGRTDITPGEEHAVRRNPGWRLPP